MIYIRDDDVLFPYKTKLYPDPEVRFREVHEWIKGNRRFLHRPAICCWEIWKYPDTMRYILEESNAGTMDPQLHGFAHVDHTLMTHENLKSAFEWSLMFFNAWGLRRPRIFYSPWGYQNELVVKTAKEFGLVATGIQDAIRLKYVVRGLRDGRITLDDLEDKEIYWHWWSGGDRIKRLCQ